jgi:hypothetical protein
MATWFIPFSLVLIILTLPLAARDPLIVAPFFVAAAGFSVYTLRAQRPAGFRRAALVAQAAIISVLAALWVTFAVTLLVT